MPSWENLPGIVDAVPVPLVGIDAGGRVRLVNACGREFLGHPVGRLMNHPLHVVFDEPRTGRGFCDSLVEGEEKTRILKLRRGDGSEQRTELTPRRLAGPDGTTHGWLIALRDADSSSAAPDDLSSCLESVAHDLRSPLASLIGFTSLLDRDFGAHLDEMGRGYLANLRTNIARVQELVENLLELGRIPRTELERVFVVTNRVLAQLAAELKPELDEGRITLLLPASPPLIYANPDRLHQVALNLLSNAIQHMGSPEHPTIRVEIETAEGGHVLVVADNGQGISAGDHLRILDLFRSTSGGAQLRGRGLGLSIVKRIMAAHGGSIDVASAPGEGATFRAFFPTP